MRIRFLVLLFFLTVNIGAAQGPRVVDFRYAPAYSFSVIGFSDDWEKTVITTKGTLGYNFGPGPYAKPLTEVGIGIEGEELKIQRQYFPDPRIPIAITEFTSSSGAVHQEAFALVPSKFGSPGNTFLNGKIQRIGGLNGTLAWALPAGRKDSAFRNTAWGVNRPIRYRLKVGRRARKKIALGFIESYKPGANLRILDARVEGAKLQELDPMKDQLRNKPHVLLFDARDEDKNGWIDVEVRANEATDPNVTLSGIWMFAANAKVTAEQIVNEETAAEVEFYYDCGPESEVYASYPRTDALRAVFNSDSCSPVVIINSNQSFRFDKKSGALNEHGHPFLITSPPPDSVSYATGRWLLHIPKGTRKVDLIVTHGPTAVNSIKAMPDLDQQKINAVSYWHSSPVPLGKIVVPDSGMQYLVEANIRNLYQTREMIDGKLQFQPGPSVYRALWIHDAVWHIDAAIMLGDTVSAKKAIENILSYQQPDGRVRIMSPIDMQAETAVMVYLVCRYAQLTQNTQWLDQHWKHIRQGIAWIQRQSNSTRADSTQPYAGLMPPGFADGGLGGRTAEYSSVTTALVGMKIAIASAHQLGRKADALSWQTFYDEFHLRFLRAAKRDMHKDVYGNWYLPLKMADTSSATPPHRAQWAFIQLQTQGHIFDIHDSLVVNAFRMLRTDAIEGLAPNSGWMQGGLWPFFSSIHGMGELWQQNYAYAENLLYDVANHASTLGTWVEEQLPHAVGTKTSGDASNATASSLYIAFVRKSIALERDSTIELLAGVPEEWLKPNATIELYDVPTEFGPLTFRVQFDSGRKALIEVSPVRGNNTRGGPAVFLQKLKRLGYVHPDGSPLEDVVRGSWGKKMRLEIVRK